MIAWACLTVVSKSHDIFFNNQTTGLVRNLFFNGVPFQFLQVEGPGVLQIQKIRNIAAPKENETSQGAPRLLKLTFTDGHLNCNGVETEKLDKFG